MSQQLRKKKKKKKKISGDTECREVKCDTSEKYTLYRQPGILQLLHKVNFGQVVRSRNQMAADGEGLGGKDVEAGNINHPF